MHTGGEYFTSSYCSIYSNTQSHSAGATVYTVVTSPVADIPLNGVPPGHYDVSVTVAAVNVVGQGQRSQESFTGYLIIIVLFIIITHYHIQYLLLILQQQHHIDFIISLKNTFHQHPIIIECTRDISSRYNNVAIIMIYDNTVHIE